MHLGALPGGAFGSSKPRFRVEVVLVRNRLVIPAAPLPLGFLLLDWASGYLICSFVRSIKSRAHARWAERPRDL